MQIESNNDNSQKVFEDIYGREPPIRFTNRKLPIIYLLVGIAFPISAFMFYYSFSRWPYLKYRPWVALPSLITFSILIIIGMLVYSVYVCKKHRFLPLFQIRPVKRLLKELIHSILLLVLLCFVIWIVRKLLTLVFQIEIQTSEKWMLVRYAPNSITLLFFLIMGFTLTPIVEEFYFRGFIYNALKTRLSILVALIVQALIFAAYHGYDLLNSFLIFIVGVALAIVFEIKKNLLTPVLMHCMINAIWFIPIIVLIGMNLHVPAKTWSQADTVPEWLDLSTFEDIDQQDNGLEQWQYAIDTWGSTGSRQWKREVKAFEAVCHWFPEDRVACAKARLSIVYIYSTYLKDHRRAIVQAMRLLQKYPDQIEPCASALSQMGWSYYMLRDFDNSRKAFDRVATEFQEYEDAFYSAQQGINWLNSLQRK